MTEANAASDRNVAASDKSAIVVLTADIVAAYVANHVVPQGELPNLIASVHQSLQSTTKPMVAEEVKPDLKPAVPIKKSYTDEMVTCLECGKGFKSLKRHIGTNHGFTPEEYKDRWSLPADYPMVAPAYAEKRSALAKESGLGQRRRDAAARKAA